MHQLVDTVHTTQRRCDELSRQDAAGRSQQQALDDQLKALTQERDQLGTERDALAASQQALDSEHGRLQAERNALQEQRDALQKERDSLQLERDHLSGKLLALNSEFHKLAIQRQELSGQLEALSTQGDEPQQERDCLNTERSELQANPKSLHQGKAPLKTETKTLVGKEGYLFLINDSNRELDVHISGFDPRVGERDFTQLAVHIFKYHLIIFPDKSVICRDKLPLPPEKIYRHGLEECRRFIGDRLIDPTPLLVPSDYYKTDTHMNLKGLLKCASLAMTCMGIPFPYKPKELRLEAKTCILSEDVQELGDLTWPSNLGKTKIKRSELTDTYFSASCIKKYYDSPATAPEVTVYSLSDDSLQIANIDEAAILSWDVMSSHIIEIRNTNPGDCATDLRWLIFYDSSLTAIIDLVRLCCSRAYFVKDCYSKRIVDIIDPDQILEFRTERFL